MHLKAREMVKRPGLFERLTGLKVEESECLLCHIYLGYFKFIDPKKTLVCN